MSEDFELHVKEVPALEQLLDALTTANVRSKGDSLSHGASFYIPGVSTRSVSVSCNRNTITVKINALSSQEDCILALDIVAKLSRLCSAKVQHEYMGEVDVNDFPEVFNQEWFLKKSESGARIVSAMIEEGHGPMCIPGPVRNVFIGERVLQDFKSAAEQIPLWVSYLHFIRHVQYSANAEMDASVFSSESKDKVEDFCVWSGNSIVLPPVKWVILIEKSNEEDTIKVPFESLPALCGDHLSALDEKQYIVDAFSSADWQKLREKARLMAA